MTLISNDCSGGDFRCLLLRLDGIKFSRRKLAEEKPMVVVAGGRRDDVMFCLLDR